MLSLIDWVHVPRMIVKIILGVGPASEKQYYKANCLSSAESIPRAISDFVSK